DALVGRVFSRSDDDLAEVRLDQADAQAEGARLFREVVEIVLDSAIPAEAVRAEVFRRIPVERLDELVRQGLAGDVSRPEQLFAILRERFPYVRSFASAVLEALTFQAAPAGEELIGAIEILKAMGTEGGRKVPAAAPSGFIPPRWRKAVEGPAGVDRRAWELCLLSEVRGALRAGELTVVGSRRYTPWDAGLYSRQAWPQRRGSWLAERRLPDDGATFVRTAKDQLHALTEEVARRLPHNPDARVDGDRLALSAPDRLEVPTETAVARAGLTGLLPLVDLAELLMEVDGWVGFSDPLLHLSARREPTPRNVAATRPALFAVLLAEATNLGLATMARASGIPYGQLLRVHESCFGEDALREAISALVRYHRSLPLTASFGPGTTSSSDGMRFGTSASGLHARHLPRYFGVRRGVSVYSHVSDQGSQFWVGVVNCQLREATFVLDGLLYQDSPPIREHYTDTHGYTDLLFGLFELLGFRFAPRLRDLPDQTLYRARRGADYGSLSGVLRRTIRDEVIVEHWDELNRLAASLADGLVPPSMLVSKLQGLRRQNALQQAIQ
ncbi:MAG: Tn3 family transposase, partial [Acidimicrobiales bacterium]